ncbi:pentapeptide repeat-containing protein [Meridianimarinicoccus roseus]|uniref:pentapeptide repeat-containing protein n=1 Tax=Meridianimarinicoccus roseus TaxID=2072018 RepID=UPI002378E67E|nr:pentapeptide repeat-containing protein [Meridianimarinicoccus roseus]
MTALAALAASLGGTLALLLAATVVSDAKVHRQLSKEAATRIAAGFAPVLKFVASCRGRQPWWFFALLVCALVLVPVWGALFWRTITLLFGIFDVTGDLLNADPNDSLRWYVLGLVGLITALGGLLAAPLAIIRTYATERQTRTAEENLTTDLINKAVEGLGAQKEVNRLGRTVRFTDENDQPDSIFEWKGTRESYETVGVTHVADWQNITQTVPNIEVRLGAIYALERIAQDSDRDHVRVMEILCAYIRQNAPASGAQPNPLDPWPDYREDPSDEVLKKRAEDLKTRRADRQAWIGRLQADDAPRADIDAAMEVIGRRSDHQRALEQKRKHRQSNEPYRLDLRKTNLQAADLSNLNLARALLAGVHLEGADLSGARMEGADLNGARMEGANLYEAHLEGADLAEARMEGADFRRARIEGANLTEARMEGADLRRARMEGADLYEARMEGANLYEARMGGADLRRARMEGADLSRARFSEKTSLRPATLQGASLRDVNLSIPDTDLDDLPRLLAEAFGDVGAILPEGLTAGEPPLEHWSTERLNQTDFQVAWLAHKRAIGYRPPD